MFMALQSLHTAGQSSDQAECLPQAQMGKIDRLEKHHRACAGNDGDTLVAAESNRSFGDAVAQ